MATTIEMTERESVFLRGQAREARDRLSGSLTALPRNLGRAVSPLAWTARFPWVATGATVLGVFGLAVALQRRDARSHAASHAAATRQPFARPAATTCPVRRAGIKTARLARGALRRFVARPLRAAVIAHVRGMF